MTFSLLSPAIICQTLEIAGTLLISGIFNYLLRSCIKLPDRLQTRSRQRYVVIIRNIVTILLAILTIHIILLIVGINITPILASIGFIGVFTAIVVNSVFGDLVGGFFLLSQSNIVVGDYINVGGDIKGTIVTIGIKNMTLRGDDGARIIVPNSQVKTIINYSNGRIKNYIDTQIKIDRSIDEILGFFTTVIEEMKKETSFKIYDESTVIGIKNADMSAMNATITVMLMTAFSLRLKIHQEFYYRLFKLLESKKK